MNRDKLFFSSFQRIISNLQQTPIGTFDMGLLSGETGIAIFFFLYSVYSRNKSYEKYAEELLDDIGERYRQIKSINYTDGLIGICLGLEYLMKYRYLENSDEIFHTTDDLLNQALPFRWERLDLNEGITGIGKYFLTRKLNQESLVRQKFDRVLEDIYVSLDRPYPSYRELLSIIDFLAISLLVNIEFIKVQAYLNYAIDKVEVMLNEDLYFGVQTEASLPLCIATKLLHISHLFDDESYARKAIFFLDCYEKKARKMLSHEVCGISSGPFKWSVLYNYLGEKLKNKTYERLSEEWLQKGLNALKEKEEHHFIPGLWKGYAGIGLTLLILSDACPEDWMDLIPLFPIKNVS